MGWRKEEIVFPPFLKCALIVLTHFNLWQKKRAVIDWKTVLTANLYHRNPQKTGEKQNK